MGRVFLLGAILGHALVLLQLFGLLLNDRNLPIEVVLVLRRTLLLLLHSALLFGRRHACGHLLLFLSATLGMLVLVSATLRVHHTGSSEREEKQHDVDTWARFIDRRSIAKVSADRPLVLLRRVICVASREVQLRCPSGEESP
jgi:hypothetical protein